MWDRGPRIRLPANSGVPSRKAFLKLLRYVDPRGFNGFGFEGSLLRPGALVRAAQLRPSANYPEIPVILEYSHAPAAGIPGNRRADGLYVLWQWSHEMQRWQELGRVTSRDWDWAVYLRPLAVRALAQGRTEAQRLTA